MNDLFELADRLETKLKKIETLTSSVLVKAQLSHSLLVVRKISEDKIEELNKILD